MPTTALYAMRYLQRVINAVVDTFLACFTPLWRRQGHEAAAHLSRYIHHHRPKLSAEKLAELHGLRAELREALLRWRAADTKAAVEKVQQLSQELPGFRRSNWVEMLESFFVITVVFLGARTYFVQPFRIPTNSMWPSLNGIVVHPVEEVPGPAKRAWDMLTLGSSYVDVLAESHKRITRLEERRKRLIFTETILHFDDGSQLSIPSASGAVMQYLRDSGKAVYTPMGLSFLPYRPGERIMRARVDAGDMVLVNRVAYHFRRPQRGETFVFDTRGINTSLSSSAATMRDQSGGTHFIKRLCALPGDRVQIEQPNVLINGEPCADGGMSRVEARVAPYNSSGYAALDPRRVPMGYLLQGRSVLLSTATPHTPWLREYLALGDNTQNSLDSRYWGPVRQFNVLGPASFTLWPFTSHWGYIE